MKFAIVGYCYNQPLNAWGHDEFEFVSRRRDEATGQDPLWVEFVCLATGYLLGLFQSNDLNDAGCRLFEAQLPGFMWAHADRFTSEA